MAPIVLHALPGNESRSEALAQALAGRGLAAASRPCMLHRFPDGETRVTVATDPAVSGSEAVVVCTLDRPDAKLMPLLLAAAVLRDLGARRVGLVAPYLPYLRQDARFLPGEAISAPVFAQALSARFDWLLCVDPHLHRIPALDRIYTLRAHVAHAAPLLAEWVARNVEQPLVIGPDRESAQWAGALSERIGAPLVLVDKTRLGDRAVRVRLPDLSPWTGRTPVLVDDVISTGRTLVAVLEQLRQRGSPPPVCVAAHGLCAGDALPALQAAGAQRVVCTNSVAHACTPIDLTPLLADAVVAALAA